LGVQAQLTPGTLLIEMTNPGTIEANGQPGLGVQNIKRRLHYLFGERAVFQLSATAEIVTARIEITEP
jgi:LytS/YehU family sensor histidine kinase